MKKTIFITLLLITSILVSAQDLIVRTNGKKIYCKILKIDSTRVYYDTGQDLSIDNILRFKVKEIRYGKPLLDPLTKYDIGQDLSIDSIHRSEVKKIQDGKPLLDSLTKVEPLNLPPPFQVKKGTILLGGNTGFSTVSMKTSYGINRLSPTTSTSKSLELTTEIGVFAFKNCALGLAITYQSDNTEDQYEMSNSSSTFYAFPWIKIYFNKTLLKPYIYGAMGLGTSNENQTASGNINKKLNFHELGAGLAFFVNESSILEFGVGFSTVTSKYQNHNIQYKDRVNGTGFQIGFMLCL
jgi:hypothetical protein